MAQEEGRRMELLLREAITVLCKNALTYQSGVTVKGLLVVTVDDQHVFLISLDERIEGSSSAPGQIKGSSLKSERIEGSSSVPERINGTSSAPEPSPSKPMTSSASAEAACGTLGEQTPGWDAGNSRRTTPFKRRYYPQQYSDNNNNIDVSNSNNKCISSHNTVTTLFPQQQQQQQDPDQPPAKRLKDNTTNINDDDEIQVIKSEEESDESENPPCAQEGNIDDIPPLHIKEEVDHVPTYLKEKPYVTAQHDITNVKQEAYALLFLNAIRDNAVETRPCGNYGNQLQEPSQQYCVSVTMETPLLNNHGNQLQKPAQPATMAARQTIDLQPASHHLKQTSKQPGGSSVQQMIQIKPSNKSPLSNHSYRDTASGNVQYFLSSRARTSRKLSQLFACEFCGKMFTTSSGLYFHKPIHTGQWKYKCDICDKCYMEATKYRNHIKAHRKQFQQT